MLLHPLHHRIGSSAGFRKGVGISVTSIVVLQILSVPDCSGGRGEQDAVQAGEYVGRQQFLELADLLPGAIHAVGLFFLPHLLLALTALTTLYTTSW